MATKNNNNISIKSRFAGILIATLRLTDMSPRRTSSHARNILAEHTATDAEWIGAFARVLPSGSDWAISKVSKLISRARKQIRPLMQADPEMQNRYFCRTSRMDDVQDMFDELTMKLSALRPRLAAEWPRVTEIVTENLKRVAPDTPAPTLDEYLGRVVVSLNWEQLAESTSIPEVFEGISESRAAQVRAQMEQKDDEVERRFVRSHLAVVSDTRVSIEKCIEALNGDRFRFENLDTFLRNAGDVVEFSEDIVTLKPLAVTLERCIVHRTDIATEDQRADWRASLRKASKAAGKVLGVIDSETQHKNTLAGLGV